MATRLTDEYLVKEISRLKKEKEITLLAHYYQRPEIQDLADYVGDSLGLAQKARDSNASSIVFAGVHFMAQTAKILNPRCSVLLPEPAAGCSLSDSCPPDQFAAFLGKYPDHVVVTYINCSAEIKAMSHIVCTSSNAEKIIRSIPPEKKIVFAPDKNLGKYLISKTGREMVLWDGSCIVHEAFAIDKLIALHRQFPAAQILAHPESQPHVLRVAHFVGSTTGIINFARRSTQQQFIVATEAGILHSMTRELPDKILIPAPTHENNTCACSECPYMKMNTLRKIYDCMRSDEPGINIPEPLRIRALKPLLRMMEISEG